MITPADYWMGRDRQYRGEFTDELARNAEHLLGKVNRVLDQMAQDGIEPGIDPHSLTAVSSGWRPRSVNDKTANAVSGSKHIQALAVDIRDTPGRNLVRWCLTHLDVLEAIGLWMEDPRWTPTWMHLQCLPPGSGRRVFIPSTAPALMAKLREQGGIA